MAPQRTDSSAAGLQDVRAGVEQAVARRRAEALAVRSARADAASHIGRERGFITAAPTRSRFRVRRRLPGGGCFNEVDEGAYTDAADPRLDGDAGETPGRATVSEAACEPPS
jgi:hypothetical protein